ncbi:hypothetical protein EAI_00503 [Harpegnathos saltator]|uniref:Uncharacterized protein n=1 Tax=Harpegnathos saltator TaxID=610380 RepID=E2BJM8_HARSA|nr:hypothetical protein EAI_00503 [Harpegnathos saltator]
MHRPTANLAQVPEFSARPFYDCQPADREVERIDGVVTERDNTTGISQTTAVAFATKER